jgi:hypothetical protein
MCELLPPIQTVQSLAISQNLLCKLFVVQLSHLVQNVLAKLQIPQEPQPLLTSHGPVQPFSILKDENDVEGE